MNLNLERSLRKARKEYARRGALTLKTYVQLAALGVIVSEIEAQWETEKNEGK